LKTLSIDLSDIEYSASLVIDLIRSIPKNTNSDIGSLFR